MIVFVNSRKIEIFSGARIRDALLCYSKNSFKKISSGHLVVQDRFGYETALDGPLIENQKIYIKIKNK